MRRLPVGDAQADDADLLVALGRRRADAGEGAGMAVEFIAAILLDVLAGYDRAYAEVARLHLAGQHFALQVIDRLSHHPAGAALFVADAAAGAQHFRLLEQQLSGWPQGRFDGRRGERQAGQREEENSHDRSEVGESAYLRSLGGFPASPGNPMLR